MLKTVCHTSRGEIPLKGLEPRHKEALLDAEIWYVDACVDVTAPTTAQPGTIGKAAVLHVRWQRGVALFMADDAVSAIR